MAERNRSSGITPGEIKALRKELGRTQNEFGRLLGLSGNDPGRTIRQLEAGEREPTGPMLRLLTLLRDNPRL